MLPTTATSSEEAPWHRDSGNFAAQVRFAGLKPTRATGGGVYQIDDGTRDQELARREGQLESRPSGRRSARVAPMLTTSNATPQPRPLSPRCHHPIWRERAYASQRSVCFCRNDLLGGTAKKCRLCISRVDASPSQPVTSITWPLATVDFIPCFLACSAMRWHCRIYERVCCCTHIHLPIFSSAARHSQSRPDLYPRPIRRGRTDPGPIWSSRHGPASLGLSLRRVSAPPARIQVHVPSCAAPQRIAATPPPPSHTERAPLPDYVALARMIRQTRCNTSGTPTLRLLPCSRASG